MVYVPATSGVNEKYCVVDAETCVAAHVPVYFVTAVVDVDPEIASSEVTASELPVTPPIGEEIAVPVAVIFEPSRVLAEADGFATSTAPTVNVSVLAVIPVIVRVVAMVVV